MFDNSKPNVIFISDQTDWIGLPKALGVFKVARELRLAGYEVAVLYHASVFSFDEICHILKNLISSKTLFVGFNNMFYFDYPDIPNDILFDYRKGGRLDSAMEYHEPGSMLPHGKSYNSKLKTFIKNINPKCKLSIGGPTAYDNQVYKDFDYVMLGYSDISIVNLANHLSKNEELIKSYKSIHGFTVINDSKADGYDFSNREMFFEKHDCILPGESLPIEISRGCIFRCAFCSYPLNGKKKFDYIKDADVLYKEFIDNYEKFNITRYLFMDDTFNDSKEKVELIYSISKRLPFQLEYFAYIRLDLLAAHKDTIDILFKSGLRHSLYGVETFNKESGEIIGKGMSKEKYIETLTYINKTYGKEITSCGSFILGLPKESIESMRNTFDYLLDNRLFSRVHLNPLSLGMGVKATGFSSELTNHPEKFGYRNIRPINNADLDTGEIYSGNVNYWENDYTNFFEVVDLSNHYLKLFDNGLSDFYYMNAVGLGIDTRTANNLKNRNLNQINWLQLKLLRHKRINEYKNLFYTTFKIPQINI